MNSNGAGYGALADRVVWEPPSPRAKDQPVLRRANSIISLVTFAGGVIVVVLCFVVATFSNTSAGALKNADDVKMGFLEKNLLPVIEVSNEYPKVKSLELYSFDAEVVEPHRVTYLRIADDVAVATASYSWKITDESGHEVETVSMDVANSEVSVEFTVAGQFYTIRVQESSSGVSITQKVICKYVRRELRALNYVDKEKFRHAMRVFHTMPTHEGREKYGVDFFNYRDATILHLAYVIDDSNSTCSPWHNGGLGFFTGHWGMARMTEKVLQLIHPDIALPYYDYTFDSEHYGADFQTRSAVFTDEYMGAYGPSSNAAGAPLGGFWEGLPTPWVTQDHLPSSRTAAAAGGAYGWVPELAAHWGKKHNGHGMITEFYNMDAMPYVTRSGTMCGRRITELSMPDCAASTLTLKQDSLNGTNWFIQGPLHSIMHQFIGGAWDCAVDTPAALEPGGMLAVGKSSASPSDFMKLAVDLILLLLPDTWGTMYDDGNYNQTQSNSSLGESGTTMSCELDVDSLTDDEVYDYISEYTIIHQMQQGIKNVLGISFHDIIRYDAYSGNGTGNATAMFQGADDLEDKALKRFMLKQVCFAGSISPYGTPLGATADPLFFPVHSFWMKHMARLALTKPDFDWSWHDISVSGCWGHGEWDAQGWTEAGLRADGGGSGLRLTNREMVEFFHPSNPKLPYVHDNLRMGCITDDSL